MLLPRQLTDKESLELCLVVQLLEKSEREDAALSISHPMALLAHQLSSC